MTAQTPPLAKSTLLPGQSDMGWGWVVVALGAHTGWGAYPVLARYLQNTSGLPSMSLILVGNLFALLLLLGVTGQRLEGRVFRSRLLWLFGLVAVMRSITNLLAARYTLAIYVQLITLMTPFLVTLLSATLLREPIPRFTGRAIVLSVMGSLLLMSGDLGALAEGLALGGRDWIGIGLACTSCACLAFYMLLVRRTMHSNLPSEAVFVVQLLSVVFVSGPLSVGLGEDWGQWRLLGVMDWVVFGAFSLGVLLGANLGQIASLRHLGAPMVSSLMGWRLVTTLGVAWILLEERLTSPWQFLGAVLVFGTISWYLHQQTGPRPGRRVAET